jgi:hypothetical protein
MFQFDCLVSAVAIIALITITIAPANSQPPRRETIYDESKVPPYSLPDPLVCLDGTAVKDAKTWRNKRRPELLKLCESEWFGKTPCGRPPNMRFVVRDEKKDARNGKATRLRIGVLFDGKEDGPQMEILVYLPNQVKRAPLILALNFDGNYTTTDETDIPLPKHWVNGIGADKPVDNQPAEILRGGLAHSWQYDYALEHGFGIATIGYGEIEPDFDGGRKLGFRAKVAGFLDDEATRSAGDGMGAIGAWAWALSRAMDYLSTNPRVDAKRVAVQGHSRLGKVALWAVAQDERFAIAISNDSGAGGAALNKRIFGETVADLNRSFPHWFCPNFAKYNDHEELMPIDSHELIALIAPRPILITSATEDRWADPKGEFLAGVAADPVYRLLCHDGISQHEWPEASHLLMGRIGYFLRPGIHDVTMEDWKAYIAFAEKWLRK